MRGDIKLKKLVIYVHGKGGTADEAKHYRPLFAGSDVVGFDYAAQNPWEAREEFSQYFDLQARGYDEVVLVANSIGAYLAMNALAAKKISKALFISPVVDMAKLIYDMMMWANVSEDELQLRKEIPTEFGETLSWEYLSYARSHPIEWSIPTCILYGGKDNLTSRDSISEFSKRIGAALTVMEDGEHWFHTEEQMRFLDDWIMNATRTPLKDTMDERIRTGRQILFSKDDAVFVPLMMLIDEMPRRAVVLWALELAEEAVIHLEKEYPSEDRPRLALTMTRSWAAGRIKMPAAKRAILDCHALAKEISSAADIAWCHAIGQACGTVHAKGHAIGFPIYDLSALIQETGTGSSDEQIRERMDHYMERLLYWQENYEDYPGEWAGFLMK